MYLVSLCSLSLAAKMEESERRIPKASSLRPLVGDAFTCSDFLQACLCAASHLRSIYCKINFFTLEQSQKYGIWYKDLKNVSKSAAIARC